MRDETVLTARGPAELLGAVPYLLGFHPQDSVVAAVVEDGSIACVARIDLRDAAVSGRAAMLLHPFLSQAGDGASLALVAYGDDGDQVEGVIAEVAGELPVPTFAALVVSCGRWWFVGQSEESEPYEPGSSLIAAEAAYRGLTARPTRADLEQVFRPPRNVRPLSKGSLLAAARRVDDLTPARARRRLGSLLDGRVVDPGAQLATRDCADVLMLLDVPAARDAFWFRLGRENADVFVDLFLQVAWRAPADLSLGAVCAAGLSAWQGGTGALVSVALERADQLGGRHPLHELLVDIHGYAVPPSALDEIRAALLAECA